MAACGSLEHIFKKPLPENPSLLESLSSWKRIKSMNSIDDSSFTEIFGELHFKESPHVVDHPPESISSPISSSSSPFPQSSPASSLSSNSTFSTDLSPSQLGIDIPKRDENESSNIYQEKSRSSSSSYYPSNHKKQYKNSDSFSSMNSESLSLCTEGLGFESSDDTEDLFKNDISSSSSNDQWKYIEEKQSFARNASVENHWGESKRSRTSRGEFPPPISCIGKSGKPWVCFKSYRENGRFILKEIRIPTQEFLHACREDGRLKLHFIQSDDEGFEEDDEESVEEKNEEETCYDDGDRDGEEERNEEKNVETSNGNVKEAHEI